MNSLMKIDWIGLNENKLYLLFLKSTIYLHTVIIQKSNRIILEIVIDLEVERKTLNPSRVQKQRTNNNLIKRGNN